MHHVLGKCLAALQPRGRGGRPEAAQAPDPQFVGGAGNQGYLRPDDGQIRLDGLGQVGHSIGVGDIEWTRLCQLRGAGVTGGADQRAHGRVARQRPAQRVLPASRTDDEDLHLATRHRPVGRQRVVTASRSVGGGTRYRVAPVPTTSSGRVNPSGCANGPGCHRRYRLMPAFHSRCAMA